MAYRSQTFAAVQAEHSGFDRTAIWRNASVLGDFSLLIRGMFTEFPPDPSLDAEVTRAERRVAYGMSLESMANTELESDMHRYVGGVFTGELVVVRHDGDPLARGAHRGRLAGDAEDLAVLMSGVINAGTHRPPNHHCEAFDQVGHLEGSLTGAFRHPERGECTLVGAYLLDTVGPPDDDIFDVTGVFEGVVLAPAGEERAVTPRG